MYGPMYFVLDASAGSKDIIFDIFPYSISLTYPCYFCYHSLFSSVIVYGREGGGDVDFIIKRM